MTSYNLLITKAKALTEKQFLIILLTADFLLRTFRLWVPGQTYFDEKPFYIKAALDYLRGITTTNYEHPPLAKLIMAVSIKIAGDNPFGWRLPGVILGTIGVFVTYQLTKKLTGSKKLAALAAVLLSCEFGWFVSSRVATIEIYLAFFLLVGSYFAICFWKEGKLTNFLLMSLFFGLSIATKWSAVLMIGWVGLFLFVFAKINLRLKLAGVLISALVISLVYLASYLPYFQDHSWGQFLQLQKKMVTYHTQLVPQVQSQQEKLAPKDLSLFKPWTWVFDPLFGYYRKITAHTFQVIFHFFNPIVFFGGLASLLYLARKQLRIFSREEVFLIGAFASQWLPWFLVTRYSFPYYLLAGMPFLIVGFSLVLREMFRKNKTWFYVVVVSSVVSFILFYPFLAAVTLARLY